MLNNLCELWYTENSLDFNGEEVVLHKLRNIIVSRDNEAFETLEGDIEEHLSKL